MSVINYAETALARIAQADRALAEATTAADAVTLVAQGKTLARWAEAVHAGQEHERTAAVFVLRAMRNAGQRIAEAQARGEVARRQDGTAIRDHVDGSDKVPATLPDIGVTRDQSSDWKRLAEEYPTDEALAEAAQELERPTLAGALRLAPLMSSGSAEWYTPPEVIERTVQALGAIDLDPCADPGHNIPAAHHFTEANDGLAQPWVGRIYMNPPYGRVIADWVAKLLHEYDRGAVSAAVALVPARTDTAWFGSLARASDYVCFVTGRLEFSEAGVGAPFPSALFYIGDLSGKFLGAFSDFGLLFRRLGGEP